MRDASRRPTGIVQQAGAGAVRNAAGFLRELPEEMFESSSMQMLEDFSRAGLTSSAGACQYADTYRQWQREGKLSMRFFCFRTAIEDGRTTDQVMAEIPNLRFFDGDEWIDYVNWGERLVGVTDNVTDTEPMTPPETFAEWGRVARAVAKAGIPIFIHTTMEWTVEAQLQQVEMLAKEMPIRHLRWAFVHMEQVTPSQIDRMKKLGMYIGVHPRTIISGASFNRDHGDRSYAMPPLKAIQDSGIQWGFGTDAFEVNQYRPVTTLWWAVTGKMVGGEGRQPPADQPRGCPRGVHEEKRVFHLSRKRPRLDPNGQTRRPGGDRPRLPHRASGRDQGDRVGADHRRRKGRLRRCRRDVEAVGRSSRTGRGIKCGGN